MLRLLLDILKTYCKVSPDFVMMKIVLIGVTLSSSEVEGDLAQNFPT